MSKKIFDLTISIIPLCIWGLLWQAFHSGYDDNVNLTVWALIISFVYTLGMSILWWINDRLISGITVYVCLIASNPLTLILVIYAVIKLNTYIL